jgi:EAL domain-containing protein (putative c-di-GMP-specific phosphodiesterase class I)
VLAFEPQSGVEDRAIVAAVVSLAEEMGMAVVAEGIETEDQLAEIRRLGCPHAQGFYFARPAPAEDMCLDGFGAALEAAAGS